MEGCDTPDLVVVEVDLGKGVESLRHGFHGAVHLLNSVQVGSSHGKSNSQINC